MTVYIALLRGINVGGKNVIKMIELKQVFESIGLSSVKTYIQSGNVMFKSDEEENFLCTKIENEIEKVFEFSVPVILRTAEEFKAIIQNCSFSDEEIAEAESLSEGECLYVSLLTSIPSQEKIEQLNALKRECDKFKIKGREIFHLFHGSIRDSKVVNNLYKLGTPFTSRNWKTMNKLFELAMSMKD